MTMFDWLPSETTPLFATVLVLASFFTSALTAALGLGGGVAMLAIMGTGLPVTSLLPVHGIVQLGSNFGRTVIQHRFVHWELTGWFFAGSVVGIAIGGPVATALPDTAAKIALALFILWSVHGRKPKPAGTGRAYLVGGGIITSIGTMIVGATGPLVAALLSARGLTKQPLIATHATCMVLQHGLKILAFGLLGFAYAQWAPLLAAMIASGVFGTWVGSRLLDQLPESTFRFSFRIVMTLLSAQIIWNALYP
ncbi:permease [Rhizobium sp. ACO-34A]|nr:sulfite exporter TauE/SafE family protein [Rhizobium sp. ACO-34A]ATN35962.1 permease [Rhizobium sp. ACO-34A]